MSESKNIIKISDFLKKNIEQEIQEIYGPEDLFLLSLRNIA